MNVASFYTVCSYQFTDPTLGGQEQVALPKSQEMRKSFLMKGNAQSSWNRRRGEKRQEDANWESPESRNPPPPPHLLRPSLAPACSCSLLYLCWESLPPPLTLPASPSPSSSSCAMDFPISCLSGSLFPFPVHTSPCRVTPSLTFRIQLESHISEVISLPTLH